MAHTLEVTGSLLNSLLFYMVSVTKRLQVTCNYMKKFDGKQV
jgi:hypothetical protein